jgi:hypothetical protein
VAISEMKESGKIYIWEGIGNYSLAGFELRLERHYLKYLFNYFLPSGTIVTKLFTAVIYKCLE